MNETIPHLSACPGVTVDLRSGLVDRDGSRVRVEIATGTFAWCEAKDFVTHSVE